MAEARAGRKSSALLSWSMQFQDNFFRLLSFLQQSHVSRPLIAAVIGFGQPTNRRLTRRLDLTVIWSNRLHRDMVRLG